MVVCTESLDSISSSDRFAHYRHCFLDAVALLSPEALSLVKVLEPPGEGLLVAVVNCGSVSWEGFGSDYREQPDDKKKLINQLSGDIFTKVDRNWMS